MTKKYIIDLAKKLIEIDSNSANPDSINKTILLAQNELENVGLKIHTIKKDNIVSIYTSLKDTYTPDILLNGHLDVVPGSKDQFNPYISDNKLFGRGAYDMKTACSVFISLMRDFSRLENKPNIGLLLVSDEEIGGERGTFESIEEGILPKFVITGEPTDLSIRYKSKGVIQINIIVSGKSAHSSRPWEGDSATSKSIKLLNKLEQYIPNVHKEEWKTTLNIAEIKSQCAFNVVSDKSEINLDIRYIPEDDPDKIIHDIENIFKGESVNIIFKEPPLSNLKSNVYIERLKDSINSINKEVKFTQGHGSSDARYYTSRNIPAVAFGPNGTGLHSKIEFVDTDSIGIYYKILYDFMNSNFEKLEKPTGEMLSKVEKTVIPVQQEGVKWKVEVFTGIRPTGDLTVANFVGAVAPMLELQKQGKHPLVFVADLHAMTDKEPKVAMQFTNNVVADYIALGLNPEQTDIFVQSAIAPQIGELTLYLMRHITISELIRVPTLKDKLKAGQRGENASALLATYPVMMAADILIQKAKEVPVGEDQVPHIEVARLLARRFNAQYGETLYVPKVQQVETLRIQSLKGEGKMSKTNPSGAIFLTDSLDEVVKKIKKAETAFAGEMSSALESHASLAKSLAYRPEDRLLIDEIISAHMQNQTVMGDFKKIFTKIIVEFIENFQQRRALVVSDPTYIPSILEHGARKAKENADETLSSVCEAMTK
jgi:succinyl-diaminopimelate desuccinylase